MNDKKFLTPDEIKRVEFEILCRFSKYCDENNLRYYLCGGTLLGAIRHKGFIPWDDDIDILMPREDYEEFLKMNQESKIFSIGTIRDNSCNLPFTKIFDTKTFVDQKYSQCLNMNHLWIDVFPMDGLPNSKFERKLVYKKARFFRKMLGVSESKLGTGTSVCKKIFKSLIYFPSRWIGASRWAKWLDAYAQKYSFTDSTYIGGLVWGYGPQEAMLKKDYLPYVEVEFEGKFFHAPKCYDTYLKNLYGDYMELPPEEKRLNHSMVVWENI